MTHPTAALSPSGHLRAENEHVESHPREQRSFAQKAVSVAKFLMLATGTTAIVAVAAATPAVVSGVSAALAKVGGALGQTGAFIAGNAAAFASGTLGAGVLNVIDGVMSIRAGNRKTAKLMQSDLALNASLQNSKPFSKLKSLYASMRRRGAFQTAIGVAAVAVGALALAGVVSNPIGLGVTLGVAAAVLLGVQIHKWRANRQIKAQLEAYDQLKKCDSAQAQYGPLPAPTAGVQAAEVSAPDQPPQPAAAAS
ncbi:MAG TPA: hypothetical protein VFV39_08150 [Limnobacter sp.]|nr:hypothetical protein [Limnobacter sp.]